MLKRVSGWKFLLLGYVTFGIYPIIVWCRMAKNLNRLAEKNEEKRIRGYIGAMLLGWITFGIYPFVWLIRFFRLAARLNQKLNAGVYPPTGVAMFFMSWIPFYSFFWVARMNNKLVEAGKNQD